MKMGKNLLSLRGSKSFLTSRQLQILFASLHGETNKEVAKKLCLSPRTVDGYWYEIYKKFRSHSGFPCTKAQVIQIFLENSQDYLNISETKNLLRSLQLYRSSIILLHKDLGLN